MAALARRGSPAALRALAWASRHSDSAAIRRRSGEQLEQLAARRGVTVQALLAGA